MSERFDIICHECNTKLDHTKLRWRQKKYTEFGGVIDDNNKYAVSNPTCDRKITDRLFERELQFSRLIDDIRNGLKITADDMFKYMATHSDVKSEVYEKFLGNDFLRITTGKDFDRESEQPNKIFGSYEFLYVSKCPKCKSELETPWRGPESQEVVHSFGVPKPRISKCSECHNYIKYREQFWYIYFTKDEDYFESHVVTICKRCHNEHHHEGGYNLNFRYIA